MNKRRLGVGIVIVSLILPLSLPFKVRADDGPLTFNVESMRPVELRAAVVILLTRLSLLLEQKIISLQTQKT